VQQNDFGLEIETFPLSAFENKNINIQVKSFLSSTGLPSWCAPHMMFGSFGDVYLPKLSEWSWSEDWEKPYERALVNYPESYVVGSAQDHQPIILLPNDPAIYIFSTCGNYRHTLNTSLDNLLQTILHYAEMVELAIVNDGSAFAESRMPTRLAKEFELTFCKREPTISDPIWVYWANERCINA
jgi:hypothetical protein